MSDLTRKKDIQVLWLIHSIKILSVHFSLNLDNKELHINVYFLIWIMVHIFALLKAKTVNFEMLKKVVFRFVFQIFLITGATGLIQAQKGWELGGGLGTALYIGDLNTEFRFNELGLNAELTARYNFNSRIALKFPLSYGLIRASDSNSSNAFERARNLSFRSNIWEFGSHLEFNFFAYEHGSSTENFTPYLLGGLSFFSFNPKAYYQDEWIALQPLGTEGQRRGDEYSTLSTALVFGGGFKFDINRVWSINIELTGRILFTDYLDDVSKTYPNADQLRATKGELAVALSDRSLESVENFNLGRDGFQRGNGKNNDSFNYANIKLMYYFGRVDCPRVSSF